MKRINRVYIEGETVKNKEKNVRYTKTLEMAAEWTVSGAAPEKRASCDSISELIQFWQRAA